MDAASSQRHVLISFWFCAAGIAISAERIAGLGLLTLSSERVFNLCVCSPLDNALTSVIFNKVGEIAPNIHLVFKSALNQNTEHQLRYQEIEFVIGYEEFRRPEFACVPLFKDEMVLVASRKHPRISGPMMENDIYQEEHAVVASIDTLHLASHGMTLRINNRVLLIRERDG